MIILHNFGDDIRTTDVFAAKLEDGTYAVRWDPASKSTLYMDEATLKSKALQAHQKQIMTDNSTFSDADQFEFTDEELGLAIEEA
jgi:hypothetical protein